MLQKLRGNNAKGFTLIELMIVIAIIGILMAIAIPNFIAYRDKSFCSATESDANNVIATLTDYFSVPTRTAVPNEDPDGAATNYLDFSLSGQGDKQNTVDVSTTATTTIIEVTDKSGRCPAEYMDALDKWDSTDHTFTITMD